MVAFGTSQGTLYLAMVVVCHCTFAITGEKLGAFEMPNWANLAELQSQFPEELRRRNVRILFYEEGVLHAFGPMVPLQEFATYQPWFELGNFGVLDTMAERFAPMELSLELFVVPKECAWCSNVAVRKRCSRCNTYYCGAVCQSSDWPCHRMICKAQSFNGGVA